MGFACEWGPGRRGHRRYLTSASLIIEPNHDRLSTPATNQGAAQTFPAVLAGRDTLSSPLLSGVPLLFQRVARIPFRQVSVTDRQCHTPVLVCLTARDSDLFYFFFCVEGGT